MFDPIYGLEPRRPSISISTVVIIAVASDSLVILYSKHLSEDSSMDVNYMETPTASGIVVDEDLLTAALAELDGESEQPKKKPATKRRRVEQSAPSATTSADVEFMRGVAEKLRKLPGDKLAKINRHMNLADVEAGMVMEVFAIETMTTQYGKMALFSCILDDDDRTHRFVAAPERFLPEQMDDNMPALYAYFGKKATKGKSRGGGGSATHSYHHLVRIHEDMTTTAAMRDRARQLRAMNVAQLTELATKILSFRDFPVGTVFVTERYRIVDFVRDGVTEKVPVCKYSAVVDGRERTGEIFVPTRFTEQLRTANGVVVIVYRGQAVTADNRKYIDVSVMSRDLASLVTSI